jgi:putative lipoic acid-binding regulatory protein
MADSSLSDLLDFPCDYEFKAFGPNDGAGEFLRLVREAVSTVVPVDGDMMKSRASARGRYQCVSVIVRLHNEDQIKTIYAALRRIEGLKYLL